MVQEVEQQLNIDESTKNIIIDKLLESEEAEKEGQRRYSKLEKDAIVDFVLSRYV